MRAHSFITTLRTTRVTMLGTSLVTMLLTMLWSTPSLACAVCFDSKGENRWAFIGTTALLTFLPLAIIGGTVWWLRQRVLEAASKDALDLAALGRTAVEFDAGGEPHSVGLPANGKNDVE